MPAMPPAKRRDTGRTRRSSRWRANDARVAENGAPKSWRLARKPRSGPACGTCQQPAKRCGAQPAAFGEVR